MLKHQIKLILPKTHELWILFPNYNLKSLRFLHALPGYLLKFPILLYQLIQLFILIF